MSRVRAPSRALILGLAGLFLAPGAGRAASGGPPSGPSQATARAERGRADYVIRARVDGETKRLEGALSVTWTNPTGQPANELWFHLYHNAFSSNRSTHMIESGGSLRGVEMDDGWGWQRVTAVRQGGSDLMPSFRYRAPDEVGEAEGDDRTVFSVALPAPVGPGESVRVEIDWEAQIPRVRRRTGYKDDFLFLAHWIPILGVFEEGRGWNCHQFHANTEFFADFGTYDVTLDLPAEYEGKIGASGKKVGPTAVRDDRVTVRFVAPSPADQEAIDRTGGRPLVHGFTWTADTNFKKKTRTFHFDAWRTKYESEVDFAQRALGPDKDLRLRNVEMTLLIQREREPQWERHLDATEAALFFYGLWFGEYPYEHLTVVDPAWGGRQAGGMEYPTLFTCGTRLYNPIETHSPEGVTVHEAGHQFWYGLVGNNEFEAAWLDEGFNSYTDSEVLFRHYGPRYGATWYSGLPWLGVEPAPPPGGTVLGSALAGRTLPLPWVGFDLTPLRASGFLDAWRDQPQLSFVSEPTDPRWNDRARYLSDPDRDPIETFGWQYADRSSYSTNSYPRTAVALRSLPAVVGHEKFLRGLRHYSEKWRYGHPYPEDFYADFNEGAGVDVTWYFDELFRGTGTVDWSVAVEQGRVPEPAGFFQSEPGGEFIELIEDEDEAAPVEDAAAEDEPEASEVALESADADEGAPVESGDADDDSDQPWRADVLVVRRGELRLPLVIELRFEDGTSARRSWSREDQKQSRWLRIEHEGEQKLVAVLLDPERTYFLDTDLSDNRWYDDTDRVAPLRWSERVFNRYLHLLHWQSGVGG
jgi:hypothetical protein